VAEHRDAQAAAAQEYEAARAGSAPPDDTNSARIEPGPVDDVGDPVLTRADIGDPLPGTVDVQPTDEVTDPTEDAPREKETASASVDRPTLPAPEPGDEPVEYGRPVDLATGKPAPLFDGQPMRDQATQGSLGDCGTMATISAVAGHQPDKISDAIRENPDGSYTVTLHEARFSGPDRTEPTGQTHDLTVSPDVPVLSADPRVSAYADQSYSGVAWPSVMEKAAAGVDQTWDAQRSQGVSAAGYERLDEGTDPWDRAELMTQLTGQPAEVRTFDKTPGNEASVEAELRDRLDNGKPVVVGVPVPANGASLPHRLEAGHAYEVTAVDNGIVHLRNPWGMRHPDPMSVRDFLDITRDQYTTLE
jgi:hypothetical protein